MIKEGKVLGFFLIMVLISMSFVSAADITINSLNSTQIIFATSKADFNVNATINSSLTGITYEWKFGDGINSTTQTSNITHTYSSAGNYSLVINVTNGNISSYKKFKITVYQSKSGINTTINSRFQEIINLKNEIEENFSEFESKSINSAIDFEDLEDNLNDIKRDYENASSDQNYLEIIENLGDINIPKTIFVSETLDSSPYLPREESINLDVLESITGKGYDSESEDKYIAEIYDWNSKNLITKIKYEEISLKYSNSNEPLLKFFKITIKEKKSAKYYIILKQLDNLMFEDDYSEIKESNYYYITGEEIISFSTTENVDFTNLPLFISPSIDKLNVDTIKVLCNKNSACEVARGENWKNCSDCSRTTIIAAAIGGVILVGMIIALLMMWWYRTKYESHLFKNKNDLYNIQAYIINARNKGISDKEIKSRLKKSGWKGEQIIHAIKKSKKNLN